MFGLLIEAVVVSVVLAIILLLLNQVYPIGDNMRVFIMGLIAGVITHLGFELVGGNKWYCLNGFACQ